MAKTQISLGIATCLFCASIIPLVGCSPSRPAKAGNNGELTYENNAEKEQLMAGKPFHEAIANRDYEGAFAFYPIMQNKTFPGVKLRKIYRSRKKKI